MNPFRDWTPEMVDDYNARQKQFAGGRLIDMPNLPIAKPVDEEIPLHYEILEECKRRGWLAFHGSTSHRTHRTKGENDFHCLLPNGLVLFIECKTSISKLSLEQQATQRWMEKLGHTMHVVRSFNQFLELCDASLNQGSTSAASKSYPAPKGQAGT